jgi:hypothetical protein
MDEHRIGLKPILRGVWALEWLYVWGFVEQATGATGWNVSNAVCKELFEAILLDFAKSAGAGANKRIVLQLDGAGWHRPENLAGEPVGRLDLARYLVWAQEIVNIQPLNVISLGKRKCIVLAAEVP